MSKNDIIPGSPLARALDDYPVPGLSAGFADRVLAAAEARAAPLPELRRKGGGGGGGRGWRMGRRFAIGAACFGALATAAAATGMLERFDIAVPTPQKVWASITGSPVPAAAVPEVSKSNPAATAALAPVVIDGPIDTPEELGEAFRRIDEVRAGRSEVRRQIIDQRIDRAIERRRAAGLPVPDAEQEARLRERIDAVQAEREARAGQRIDARRAELRQRVENGEAITRESLAPQRQQEAAASRVPRLRDLTPQQRRQLLRDLPPEERRALADEYRRWRDQRQGQQQLRRAPSDAASQEAPVLSDPAVNPADNSADPAAPPAPQP